jgi:hypothetical protein
MLYFAVLCLPFIEGNGMVYSSNTIAVNEPVTEIAKMFFCG